MLDEETLKLLVPAIVAVLGWFAAHQFNAHRDRANKQRDLRIQFLLEAYRRLEAAANRPEAGKEEQDKFESALADIQLLGTKSQIEELMDFIEAWQSSKSGGASISPLLELLRSHLRNELKLEKNIPPVKLFRFENRFPEPSKQRNK
ncbi:MAG: hypothetical protein PXX77_04985 [Gallionella sp.]|nr:hypothetical protein [Gallionella sp.]